MPGDRARRRKLLLETDRLIVGELEAEQLEGLLPVFQSRPEYLQMVEGTSGVPGLYDLSKLRRDWWLAQQMPGRRMCGIYVKPSQAAVGVLDFIEESNSDGHPWVGLLMIHAAHGRQGYAREALDALLDHGRSLGWTAIRVGVLERNEAGLSFARAMRFRPVAHGGESSDQEVLIMELAWERGSEDSVP